MESFRVESDTESHYCHPDELSAASGDVVDFDVLGRAEMLPHIRARIARFAGSMAFSGDEIDDIALAVGEAGSNAIQYGCVSDDCYIGIHLERHPGYMRVRISDKGPGFDLSSISVPGSGSLIECGRGIMFMRMLMDQVNFSFGNPGTSVDMVKRVRVH